MRRGLYIKYALYFLTGLAILVVHSIGIMTFNHVLLNKAFHLNSCMFLARPVAISKIARKRSRNRRGRYKLQCLYMRPAFRFKFILFSWLRAARTHPARTLPMKLYSQLFLLWHGHGLDLPWTLYAARYFLFNGFK